ncbi:MAG TPA: alanine--tRNA ligase [Candidatus Omnitrophota bacterium]|nr:alanine--tRNA ligase [Candidatus Omnitrophota bacterium]HRZ15621.1 alanine--tRNA ligase [Candidatus Omnitrophota bacterium]
MMTADSIRESYLQFFKSKGHKIVESDSLVPKEDPTVLFTPAGMNQFKKQFLGVITDFTRATSSQRCLRTDDLDKVGKTDCHHTYFEMLGNFSFGDYFKKEAIAWAWEFLTEVLKISPEKLWVSVYLDDDEAYTIWKNEIKIPERKIVRLGDHDNFWPADAKQNGPNGPCGPCSEIFFDLGPTVGCGNADCNPGCSCSRFIEVWNLVFTQFNRKDGGVLEPLPQKNIDTGMGLERITAVMQGVRSNFQTDLFLPIIKEIQAHAVPSAGSNQDYYAIADHLRAVVFSIYDGVLPSNESRGYVIRKLIRKSVLHLRALGIKKAFFYKLVPVLAEVMKQPNPDLVRHRENISDMILSEENNFIQILDSSESLLEGEFGGPREQQLLTPEETGMKAFKLYDTHGLPLIIIQKWLQDRHIGFSQQTFDAEMNLQKERSKSQSAMQGDVFSLKEAQLKNVAATAFVGYDTTEAEIEIIKILKDGREVEEIKAGDEAKLILNKSSFYAESGGQVGDTGVIAACNGVFEVTDTQKFEKVILHIGKVKEGSIKVYNNGKAKVDAPRRLSIDRNHTATHLLQAALRRVLGAHIQQQGSSVTAEGFRFDFTHFKDIKKDELDRIEELVNGFVIANHPVRKKEMSLSEAKAAGALAFFAEKYEDNVRVVTVEGVSQELCGGTHLDSTGSIGLFMIAGESSVASGVRRIEACTGTAAYRLVKEQESVLSAVSQSLKAPADKVPAELEKKLKYIKDLEKQVSAQRVSAVAASVDGWIKEAEEIKGVKVICQLIKDADMDLLRKVSDLLRQKQPAAVFCLGAGKEGSAALVVATGAHLDASALVKQLAAEIGGSGGGRKDFAQAGGTRPEQLDRAFEMFKQSVGQALRK